MQNNKKFVFVGIFLFLSILGYLSYQFQYTKADIIKDVFIKNLNWDSNLEKDIPYVHGNDLELYYILDDSQGDKAKINIEKLQESVDVNSIYIGDEPVDISKNIHIDLDSKIPLKITGVSKVNNNENDTDLEKLIDIKIIEENVIPDILEEENLEIIAENLPKNLVFQQTSFQSNMNNILEVSGENISNIQYVTIGNFSIEPTFHENKAFFFIEKNTFSAGSYFVLIQPKQGKTISLDQHISFQYVDSPINIVNITPKTVKNDTDRYIVLQGNGFTGIVSIQLDNNLVIKNTDFDVINDQVVSIKVPKELSPGPYSFNIMTTQEIVKLKNQTFTVINNK